MSIMFNWVPSSPHTGKGPETDDFFVVLSKLKILPFQFSGPSEGDLYRNSDDDCIYGYVHGQWVKVKINESLHIRV